MRGNSKFSEIFHNIRAQKLVGIICTNRPVQRMGLKPSVPKGNVHKWLTNLILIIPSLPPSTQLHFSRNKIVVVRSFVCFVAYET